MESIYWFGAAPVCYAVVKFVYKRLRSHDGGTAAAWPWLTGLGRFFLTKKVSEEWARRYGVRRYYQSVLKATATLPGVRLSSGLKVDQSYTPLQLRISGLSDESLLESSGAVLLLGDAGSGKSALAQMLVRRTAKDGLRTGWRSSGRLAFSLGLKDLPLAELAGKGRDETWRFFVDHFANIFLKQLPLYSSEGLLSHAGNTGGWLIILDGLDEVRTELRESAERVIEHLIYLAKSQPGQNLLIVTARQQALQRHHQEFVRKFDEIETLGAFSVSGIFSFLLRYPYNDHNAARNADRLLKHLQLYPHLLETCRNPLALNMLVDLDQKNNQAGHSDYNYTLPETRAVFFQTVVDELLIHRRRSQLGAGQAPNSLRRAREQFFQSVASAHLDSMNQSFNRLPESDLTVLLGPSQLIRDGQTPEDALYELAEQTGLISRCGDSDWEFTHRSFLDYFAGRTYSGLRYGREIDDFLKRTRRLPERFEEALFFSCGLLSNFDRPAALSLLQDIRKSHGEAFLRACLESQVYPSESFVSEMQTAIRGISSETEPSQCALVDRILRDYNRVCNELGVAPAVSRASLLRRVKVAFGNTDRAVEFLVKCDISMVGELQKSLDIDVSSLDYEEIIRGCYEPDALPFVVANAIAPEPGNFPWSSVLAEAGLRSSLVSSSLRSEVLGPGEQKAVWSRSWPAKGTLYGHILDNAVRDLTPPDTFPHLGVLRGVRRPSRSAWRDSVRSLLSSPLACFSLVYAVALASFAIATSIGSETQGWWPAFALGGLAAVYLWMLWTRRTRIFARSLPRLLNLQPVPFPKTLAENVIVLRFQQHPPLIRLGSRSRLVARSSPDGVFEVLLDQLVPFVWLSYCPRGRVGRLRQVAAARIQQWDTDLLRGLVSTGDNQPEAVSSEPGPR